MWQCYACCQLSTAVIHDLVYPPTDSAENPHEELQQLREAGASQLTHIEEDRKQADTGTHSKAVYSYSDVSEDAVYALYS